jgi:hypothetical protein
MTTSPQAGALAFVWMLVVALITVALYEHGQAIAARASVSESVVLMDRALQEIVRSDSAVVRTLRLATQASPGSCELLAVGDHGAFTPTKGDSWKSIDLTSTP